MLLEYTELASAIRQQVKAIRWIDIDKGQLQNPDQYNSIIVPGVLIGLASIAWKQLAGGYQQGEGTISVKTIFVLPNQTHLTDPLIHESLKQLTLSKQVSDAVLSVPGVTSRLTSREYPSGTYYVNEQTFSALFTDGPTYTVKTVSLKVNPTIFNPNTP